MKDLLELNDADYLHALQFSFSLLSALLYVSYVPERFFIGLFDLVGSSHQLFHLTAVLSTWFQSRAVNSDMIALKLEENLDQDFISIAHTNADALDYSIIFNGIIFTYFFLKLNYFKQMKLKSMN